MVWMRRVAAIAAVVLACGACSDGDTLPTTTTTTTPSTTASPGATSPTAPSTTGPATTVAPRLDVYAGAAPAVVARGQRAEASLATPDGRTRTYRTYVPANRPAGRAPPLIVALHGGFGTGAQFERSSGLDGFAEANGFVVVYPDGVGSRVDPNLVQTWNGGSCCGPAVAQKVDDVTFIRLLIDDVARTTGADRDAVVVTGHSNGAIMGHRLACELSDRIVAIAVQAGGLEVPTCAPARPVSVLHLHGTADTNVPVDGGKGSGAAGVAFRSVKDTMDSAARAARCAPTPVAQTADNPDLAITTWTACASNATVRLILVRGATHAWMGQETTASALTGAAYRDFDSSRAAIAFFVSALRR
jgi:polyhydroxybutyrate depolymerase